MPSLYGPFNRTGTTKNFELNPDALDGERLHIFLPQTPLKSYLAVELLKNTTFKTERASKELLRISPIHCDDILIHWVSFPKSFLSCCEKAAANYGLIPRHLSRRLITDERNHVHIPQHPYVLTLTGDQPISLLKMGREMQFIRTLGDLQSHIEVD